MGFCKKLNCFFIKHSQKQRSLDRYRINVKGVFCKQLNPRKEGKNRARYWTRTNGP